MAKEQDPEKFIEAMDTRVTKMEKDAMDAINQRGETIGTAIVKLGIGLPLLADVVTTNWGYLNNAPENLIGLVAGLAVTAWGLRDAGQIPERFQRATALTANARLLRITLTSNIASAIEGIPFRRLEQTQTPPALGRPTSNDINPAI